MSRRYPRLSECRTMDDLVRGGFAEAVAPAIEEGPPEYGTGRNFLTGANIVPTMTSATEPSGAVLSGGDFNGTYAAWKAFNHATALLDDAWFAAAGTTGWVQYQFTTPRVIRSYAITTDNGIPYVPKTWTLQASIDGISWATLDAQTDVVDWAALKRERKGFNIGNQSAYAIYRLNITASNHGEYVGVGEFELIDAAVASNLVYTDLVAITSAGVVADGTNVAYARNSGNYYGPVVVTPTAKAAGVQTAIAAVWHDPVAVFHLCASGDHVIPLNGDSLGYKKLR